MVQWRVEFVGPHGHETVEAETRADAFREAEMLYDETPRSIEEVDDRSFEDALAEAMLNDGS